MPITMQEVRAVLDPDEPDYLQARALGLDALPWLEQLVQGSDPMLSSKAAYAAGLIGGPQAVPVLVAAIGSPDPTVRVAAAAAVKELDDSTAGQLVVLLLRDRDRGVRRQALRAVAGRQDDSIRAQVIKVSESDGDPKVRAEAAEVLRHH